MSSTAILGILTGLGFLLLVVLSQRYWVVVTWRRAARVRSSLGRQLLRGVAVFIGLFAAGSVASVYLGGRDLLWSNPALTVLISLWIASAILSYLAVWAAEAVSAFWRGRRRLQTSRSPERPVNPAPDPAERVRMDRRGFVQTAALVGAAVPLAGAFYGFAFERRRYQIHDVSLPVSGLPSALEGLRIAQLSDIHIGGFFSPAELRRVVAMTNELNADLVCVTGDLLTEEYDPLERCIEELARLRAPLGVWGCNGNHEIYSGAEAFAAERFRRFGMRILRQESAELVWRGQSFHLLGVDYPRGRRRAGGGRRPMLAAIEPLVRPGVPNILLSHNPNTFPRAAELGIQLMLAGHTHGGQVRVEILEQGINPARFLTPYIAGPYRRPVGVPAVLSDEDAWAAAPSGPASVVYVNRGLGTIGVPLRLGVPPEISLLTLRRA